MILLKNEMVKLRAVEPEDIGLLYEAENDTQIWWVGDQNVPYSRFALKQYLQSATNDIYADKQVRFVIERKTDAHPVGLIDLFSFSPSHHRAEVGILVFESFRNQGYGTHALNLLAEYAIAQLQLHQLYAYVSVENDAACQLFQSCGFNKSHILKDWLKISDGFSDVLFMQKIL